MTPKEVRLAVRVSQMQVAAASGKALPTVRAYELDPTSCTVGTREALDPVYAAMTAKLAQAQASQ